MNLLWSLTHVVSFSSTAQWSKPCRVKVARRSVKIEKQGTNRRGPIPQHRARNPAIKQELPSQTDTSKPSTPRNSPVPVPERHSLVYPLISDDDLERGVPFPCVEGAEDLLPSRSDSQSSNYSEDERDNSFRLSFRIMNLTDHPFCKTHLNLFLLVRYY